MLRMVLIRLDALPDRTLGKIIVFHRGLQVGSFASLELPDKANQRRISCIPAGRYVARKEDNSKFGTCLRVLSVRDRDGILVHAGNTPKDTSGCIIIGTRLSDIDGDGIMDTVQSMAALRLLCELVTDTVQLDVIGV